MLDLPGHRRQAIGQLANILKLRIQVSKYRLHGPLAGAASAQPLPHKSPACVSFGMQSSVILGTHHSNTHYTCFLQVLPCDTAPSTVILSLQELNAGVRGSVGLPGMQALKPFMAGLIVSDGAHPECLLWLSRGGRLSGEGRRGERVIAQDVRRWWLPEDSIDTVLAQYCSRQASSCHGATKQ